jgi:hypothetical protein
MENPHHYDGTEVEAIEDQVASAANGAVFGGGDIVDSTATRMLDHSINRSAQLRQVVLCLCHPPRFEGDFVDLV